jgi:exopolysaccharide production protein ExoQ
LNGELRQLQRLHCAPVRAGVVRTGAAAVGIAALSNGPLFAVQRYLLDEPTSIDSTSARWWFRSIAVMGVAALVAHLARRGESRLPRSALLGVAATAALCVLFVASTSWSVVADATRPRSLVYAGLACGGVWMALALRGRELLWAVTVAMSLCMALSLLVLVADPDEARMPVDGRWRGIYNNSNSLGPIAALALICMVAVAVLAASRSRPVAAAAAIAASGCGYALVRTECDTAVVGVIVVALTIGGLAIAERLRRSGADGWAVGAIAAAALALAAAVAATVARPLSRALTGTDTLSRRTIIWSEAWDAIGSRPWQGYGFYAYFDHPMLPNDGYWRAGLVYGSTHNSLLELILGVGLFGGVLWMVIVGAGAQRVLRRWWSEPTATSAWFVAIAAFVLVENASESFVLWFSYQWPLVVAFAALPAVRVADLPGPAVSVIIRTQGQRPGGLRAALNALDLQTDRDFESVVVAHGSLRTAREVRELTSTCSFPVHVVRCPGGPRSRPANLGLRRAKGQMVTLLDDDDLVSPHWIATFNDTRRRAPGHLIRCQSTWQHWSATDDGDPLSPVGDAITVDPGPFDLALHRIDNRTVNCSIAVPRQVVVSGLHFDEGQPVLEDWDFLMRCSAAVPVLDVPEVTSLVRLHDQSNSKARHSVAEWGAARRRARQRFSAAGGRPPRLSVFSLPRCRPEPSPPGRRRRPGADRPR